MLYRNLRKKNRKLSKKIIVSILVLIVLLIIVFIMFFAKIGPFTAKPVNDRSTMKNVNTTDYNPPTTDQKQAGNDIKKSNDTPPTSASFSTSIISSNINGGVLQIRTGIYGAVTSSGTCFLTLTGNSKVVSRTTKTYALPSSSTCQGFDINQSDLSAGKWSIDLTVSIDGKTAAATAEAVLE